MNRQKVVWVGVAPSPIEKSEFSNRRLAIVHCSFEELEHHAHDSLGCVLNYDGSKPTQLARIQHIASLLQNHEVKFCPIVRTESHVNDMQAALETAGLNDCRVYCEIPPFAIAEDVARHYAGPIENLNLEVSGDAVEGEDLVLLRRAFWGCKSVRLHQLPGGYSAKVFQAYAHLVKSDAGPTPLPFFVKFDKKEDIEAEIGKYKDFTSHFVPFNYRPNIDPSRCATGTSKGIIVGNFVEHAEPLWDVVRRGTGSTIVYSIFDQALRGWRLQAYEQPENLPTDSMEPWIRKTIYRNKTPMPKVPASTVEKALEYGATKNLQKLVDELCMLGQIPHPEAPTHGDLHARNIMVKGSDPILIDFRSVGRGPLVADPACLEVALVFKVAGDWDDEPGWTDIVRRLFNINYFLKSPPPAKEPLPREWLWNSVRQLRMIGLGSEHDSFQYAIAVCSHLLKLSTYEVHQEDNPADGDRRAFGYYLAERLINDISTARTNGT